MYIIENMKIQIFKKKIGGKRLDKPLKIILLKMKNKR